MKCSVSGCGLGFYAKGFCRSHYARWRNTGDPGPAKIRTWDSYRGCSVEGCTKKHFTHGYCNIHWHRMERHGDPLRENTKAPDGAHAAFIQQAIKHTGEYCLIWPYSRNDMGYAKTVTRTRNGKPVYGYATRIICAAVHGKPLTRKHEAAHNCGGGHLGCVNPMHLEWKTHQENCRDTVKHDRSTRGERNTSSKLTGGDVRKIRRLTAAGKLTITKIAHRFDVSPATIHDIVSDRTWSWLT